MPFPPAVVPREHPPNLPRKPVWYDSLPNNNTPSKENASSKTQDAGNINVRSVAAIFETNKDPVFKPTIVKPSATRNSTAPVVPPKKTEPSFGAHLNTAAAVSRFAGVSSMPPALPKRSDSLSSSTPPSIAIPMPTMQDMRAAAVSVRAAKEQFENSPAATIVKPLVPSRQQTDASVRQLRSVLENQLQLDNIGGRPAPAARPVSSYDSTMSMSRSMPSGETECFAPTAQHVDTRTASAAPPRRPAPVRPKSMFSEGQASSTQKKAPPPRPTSGPKLHAEPFAIVLYDFTPGQADELGCKAGDKVILKQKVDDSWYFAMNDVTRRVGIVPVAYLDIKQSLSRAGSTAGQTTSPPLSPGATADTDSGVSSTCDGPRCYTLHEYNTSTPGDLAFCQGEVIRLTRRLNADWLEGESSDGRQGIFPAGFVEIIEDLPAMTDKPVLPIRRSRSHSEGDSIVTALHDYEGESVDDLTFKAGEKISVTEIVNTDWLRGKIGLRSGIFPANFVDHVPRIAQGSTRIHGMTARPTSSAAAWVGRTVIALYDYVGSDANDLTFQQGDRIHVTEEVNDDWLKGRIMLNLANQRSFPTGMFPKDYVELEHDAPVEHNDNALGLALVLHDFRPTCSDELALKAGEKILVHDSISDDWLFGSKDQNHWGRFPASYVDFL